MTEQLSLTHLAPSVVFSSVFKDIFIHNSTKLVIKYNVFLFILGENSTKDSLSGIDLLLIFFFFLAVLSLVCCMGFFSSCSDHTLHFTPQSPAVVCGLLVALASPVVSCGL